MLGQRGRERHREADIATVTTRLIGSLRLGFVRRHFKRLKIRMWNKQSLYKNFLAINFVINKNECFE
jgi:hypothetical protein